MTHSEPVNLPAVRTRSGTLVTVRTPERSEVAVRPRPTLTEHVRAKSRIGRVVSVVALLHLVLALYLLAYIVGHSLGVNVPVPL